MLLYKVDHVICVKKSFPNNRYNTSYVEIVFILTYLDTDRQVRLSSSTTYALLDVACMKFY